MKMDKIAGSGNDEFLYTVICDRTVVKIFKKE